MKILSIILGLFILYTIVPFILSRKFHIGVMNKSRETHKLAFTFDDGPHPLYTPILLDVLQTHHVKATFFVHGSNAEKFPDIIGRMHKEGHLIGIHNYVHHSNWMMLPWRVRKQLKQCGDIIENITGVRPIHYRPPWGLMNLFDLFLGKVYKIVLWSVMAHDWSNEGGSEKVKRELLEKIKGGDIILLHDNGETLGADEEAPAHTLEALKTVLKVVKEKGFRCVRIDEI